MSPTPHRRLLVLNGFERDLGEEASLLGLAILADGWSEALGIHLVVDQARPDELPLRESTIATINEAYDLVLVGPGAVLGAAPGAATASGWGLDIPRELLGELTVPFGLLGVAWPDLPREGGLAPEARTHLEATCSRAAFVTARDEGTAEALGAEVGHVPPIAPDPAILIETSRGSLVDGLDPRRPTIVLDLRLDRPDARFGAPLDVRFERLMGELIGALRGLIEEHRVQVVYAPLHRHPDDEHLGRLLAAMLPVGSVVVLPDVAPELWEDPELGGAGHLLHLFRQAQVVVGMHPQTPVLGLVSGTPVVTLSRAASVRWTHEATGWPDELFIDLARFDEEVRRARFARSVELALAEQTTLRAEATIRREQRTELLLRTAAEAVGPHLHPHRGATSALAAGL